MTKAMLVKLGNMDEVALKHLWSALKPEEHYDASELPSLDDADDVNGEAEAFLWDELVDKPSKILAHIRASLRFS